MTTKTKATYTIPCPADECGWTVVVDGVRAGRTELQEHVAIHGGMPVREVRELVSDAVKSFRGNNSATLSATGDTPIETGDPTGPAELVDGREIRMIRLGDVEPNPFQTRSIHGLTDGLDELIESIRANGQEVPARARRKPGEPMKYQLAFGHRRLAALQSLAAEADDDTAFRLIAEVAEISDTGMASAVLLENHARKDLGPLELARGVKRMLDADGERVTQAHVGKALGIKQPTVSNWMRALDVLTDQALAAIDSGQMNWSHGREFYPFTLSADHRHDDDLNAVLILADPGSRIYDKPMGSPIGSSDIHQGIGRLLNGRTYGLDQVYAGESGTGLIVTDWRPLDDAAWEHDYEYKHQGWKPFDLAEYETAAPGTVHNFGDLGTWSCDAEAWERVAGPHRVVKEDDEKPDAQKAIANVEKRIREVELPKILKARKLDGDKLTAEQELEALGSLGDEIESASQLRSMEDKTRRQAATTADPELPAGVTLAEVRRYVDTESAEHNYNRNLPIMRANDNTPVVILSKMRGVMDKPGECGTCTTGRRFAYAGHAAPYTSGLPNAYDAPAAICANLTCLLTKSALKLAARKAATSSSAKDEAELTKQLIRNTAVGGHDRRSKVFLLAAFAQVGWTRGAEQYERGSRLTNWLLKRLDIDPEDEKAPAIVDDHKNLIPDAFAEAVADRDEQWIDETLAEMARVAVTDPRTDYQWQPSASAFMRLAMPEGTTS